MPHPLHPLRQNSGFSDYALELQEADHEHQQQREEGDIKDLRAQFGRATEEKERQRILSSLIPLIERSIGTGELNLVYHRPEEEPYFEYVPNTHRFFRIDPHNSGHIQELHFSDRPEREPYTFLSWNPFTRRHDRLSVTGSTVLDTQRKKSPYVQRSIGHRLAAIHGIDRDVWMGTAGL